MFVVPKISEENLEVQELRALQAIIDEQGFKKAADRLMVTQSAVSQAIANLERKLGIRIIERVSPPRVTEAGKRVLLYARQVLQEEQAVLEDLRNMRNGLFATLSVATNTFITTRHCPDLLAEFLASMPLCRVKIESLPSREIIYAVESESYELGFGPFQTAMSQFVTIPLFEENRVLATGKDRALQGKTEEQVLAFLKEIPLITSFLDRAELRPAAHKLRDRFRAIWEVNHPELRLQLVARGLGASFIEEEVLSEHPLCRDFTRLTGPSFGIIHRQIGLYHRKGRQLSDAAATFINICKRRWDA